MKSEVEKKLINDIQTIKNINKDIFSLNSLSPLLDNYPYLPYSDSSVDYHSLHIFINDITINNRHSIIEFGSGTSTILIGRLLKKNNINGTLTSVDDNKEWCKIMEERINNENLSEYVRFIHAPLKPTKLSEIKHNLDWYDTNILDKAIGQDKFDMVFIDGPIAYLKEIERSRFPALYYIQNKLENNKYSIFLHDTNREGEQSIIKDWENLLHTESKKFTNTLSGFIKGMQFTITV